MQIGKEVVLTGNFLPRVVVGGETVGLSKHRLIKLSEDKEKAGQRTSRMARMLSTKIYARYFPDIVSFHVSVIQ
jgi:hypothetical protein